MIITLIAASTVFIVVVAVVIGIIDATQTPARRELAARRRQKWEARQFELHGIDPYGVDPYPPIDAGDED